MKSRRVAQSRLVRKRTRFVNVLGNVLLCWMKKKLGVHEVGAMPILLAGFELQIPLREEENVLAIAALDVPVLPDRRANEIETAISMAGKLFHPIGRPLLVQMRLSALARHGRREKHVVGLLHERPHESRAVLRRQMLGHFQRQAKIELPSEVDRRRQVAADKPVRRN